MTFEEEQHLQEAALEEEENILLVAALMLTARKRRRQRRVPRRRIVWVKPWLLRRPEYGHYENLLRELHRENPSSYKNFLSVPPELFIELIERVQDTIYKKLYLTSVYMGIDNISSSELFSCRPTTCVKTGHFLERKKPGFWNTFCSNTALHGHWEIICHCNMASVWLIILPLISYLKRAKQFLKSMEVRSW